jgi:hypothetical protein
VPGFLTKELLVYKICLSFSAITILFCTISTAQVIINEPADILQLHERMTAENGKNDTDAGWRIQILATTERRNMDREMLLFEKRFPDLSRTEKYKKPYYRILTGAEKERMELYPLLQQVQKHYPSAFIVKDPEIPKEEFFSS